MNGKRAFIDTNILVYSYEKDKPPKRNICLDLVLKCFRGEIQLVVSNQILAEFFHVITEKSKYPLSIEEAKGLIQLIIASSNWIKVDYTISTVLRAIDISKSCGIWDALIDATMIENNISEIYTENEKDFGKIPWIEVINPLK